MKLSSLARSLFLSHSFILCTPQSYSFIHSFSILSPVSVAKSGYIMTQGWEFWLREWGNRQARYYVIMKQDVSRKRAGQKWD